MTQKTPWCWERLKARGEGDNRGWDAWMASLTWWTCVWVGSGSCWWTGRPDVLQSMGSQSRTWLSDWTEGPGVKSLISWELIFGVVWNRVKFFYMWISSLPNTVYWRDSLFLFEYSGFHELSYSQHFQGSSAGKESACSAGDLASVPGLRRSPGEGNGYPLQYSGLESSMDCTAHGVAKSGTWLSNFYFPTVYLCFLFISFVLSSFLYFLFNLVLFYDSIFFSCSGTLALLLCLTLVTFLRNFFPSCYPWTNITWKLVGKTNS